MAGNGTDDLSHLRRSDFNVRPDHALTDVAIKFQPFGPGGRLALPSRRRLAREFFITHRCVVYEGGHNR